MTFGIHADNVAATDFLGSCSQRVAGAVRSTPHRNLPRRPHHPSRHRPAEDLGGHQEMRESVVTGDQPGQGQRFGSGQWLATTIAGPVRECGLRVHISPGGRPWRRVRSRGSRCIVRTGLSPGQRHPRVGLTLRSCQPGVPAMLIATFEDAFVVTADRTAQVYRIRHALVLGMAVPPDALDPQMADVLESAARLQELVPDMVLVGGWRRCYTPTTAAPSIMTMFLLICASGSTPCWRRSNPKDSG